MKTNKISIRDNIITLARKTDLNQYPLNHSPLTFSLVMIT